MKGASLAVGSIVILALDGTLVYVEDVQSTFASVVALPEQPSARADERIFTPGKVGAKKISPFSSADRVVPVANLTERNREFIGTYEKLREVHGPHYVQRTPEEEAAMTVKKVTGRAAKRAAAKNYLKRCETCGEQPGHPNHPGKHEFVPPPTTDDSSPTEEPAPQRTPRQPRAASSGSAAVRYTLLKMDLTAAKAQPRGDKFNDGNRSHRVVCALASLPDKTGTVDEVIVAMLADGKGAPANPQKIVRRTLNQLTKPAWGQIVSTDGQVAEDSDDGE